MDKFIDLESCTKDDLIKIIEKHRSKIEELNGVIKILVSSNIQYEENSKKSSSGMTDYKQEWEWLKKILFIITKSNNALRSEEILNTLLGYDIRSQHWRDKKKTLSVYLNKAIRYKMLVPLKYLGTRGYYYALPEWISPEGELLSEYKIKKL